MNDCEYGIARGKGCLSRVPYIVGFICVLVQLASWGDAMHHALNKLSSLCSELLAGERVIRSDATGRVCPYDLWMDLAQRDLI